MGLNIYFYEQEKNTIEEYNDIEPFKSYHITHNLCKMKYSKLT